MKLNIRNWQSIATLAILLAATASVSLNAAPGDLDPSFTGSGKFTFGFGGAVDSARAVKVQPDGKLVVVGSAAAGSKVAFAVARYHPDGARDNSFGGDGKVLTDIPEAFPADDNLRDDAHSVAIQTDGKIVVAGGVGQQTGDSDFAIVRYNPDGSLDSSFGGTGIVIVNFGGFDVAYEVCLQANGKIVVGGYKDGAFAVMRLNPDGTPDTTFNGTGQVTTIVGPSANRGPRTGMALMSDNKIVMAGSNSGFIGFIVVRYNVDGSLDNSFHTDGKVITPVFQSGHATAVAIQEPTNLFESEKIVVGGYAFNGSKDVFAAVRYNIVGELDTSFNTDGIVTTAFPPTDTTHARSFSVAVEGTTPKQPRKIVLAGFTSTMFSGGTTVSSFATVRYNVDGSLDSTFNQDGIALAQFYTNEAGAGLVLSAGKVIVVGETITPASGSDFAIVRYNSDGSFDNTLHFDGKKVDQLGGAPAACRGVALQADGKIVLAGTSGQNSLRMAIARLNTDGTFDHSFGAEGKALGSTLGVEGNAVALQPDGKIVLAGTLNIGGTTTDFAVARFNPDGERDTSFDSDGLASAQVTTDRDVGHAVALQADGKILVAGYSSNGVTTDAALVRLNSGGSLDNTFDFDGRIIIGLSPGNDEARAVGIQPDGKVVIAGFAGDAPSQFFVARFNSNGTPDNSFGVNGVVLTSIGPDDAVATALALLPSGHIVLAGYASNGTNWDFALARYHANGALDSSLGGTGTAMAPVGTGDDVANTLAIQADGKMLVAGRITLDPARREYGLVRWNFDGSLDASYGTGGQVRVGYSLAGRDDAFGLALDSSNRAVVAGEAGELFGVARIEGGPLVPTVLANISTRLRVLNGDNALIGGMIATGTTGKRVIIRAIGPTLTDFGLPGALQDPTLELFQGDAPVASNDDWRNSSQQAEIANSGLAPNKDAESAIIATLTPNQNYTAVVRGANNGTGIGVVEAYDLDRSVDSQLANISTRGLVQTGDNVLIAGTIVLGPSTRKVIVRAIGPSLPIAGALADPSLELRNANGDVIRSNDNWRTGGQETEIIQSGVPPANDSESALVETLSGNGATYTAIVRGAGNATGVAVVEVYALN